MAVRTEKTRAAGMIESRCRRIGSLKVLVKLQDSAAICIPILYKYMGKGEGH